jgi:hypothetical protein
MTALPSNSPTAKTIDRGPQPAASARQPQTESAAVAPALRRGDRSPSQQLLDQHFSELEEAWELDDSLLV